MKSKLTPRQIDMVERLQKADEIHAGGYWYYKRSRTRYPLHIVDGRVCEALKRKGILRPVEGDRTRHTLHPPEPEPPTRSCQDAVWEVLANRDPDKGLYGGMNVSHLIDATGYSESQVRAAIKRLGRKVMTVVPRGEMKDLYGKATIYFRWS